MPVTKSEINDENSHLKNLTYTVPINRYNLWQKVTYIIIYIKPAIMSTVYGINN